MIRRLIILLLIVGCEETLEPEDCAGVAGGAAGLDSCAVCIGGTTNLTACVQDCADVWGGTAVEDDCGLCTGGTTGLIANYTKDCAGECGGDNAGYTYIDSMCYFQSDLDVLQDLIDLHDFIPPDDLSELGDQYWFNGRIVWLTLFNYQITNLIVFILK